ncbi:MAG: hypothetical protein SGJ23_04415 [Alphaproteobacteria bacterium]|nr:hypothetical protein [Alphaproteobacteria bacterium]
MRLLAIAAAAGLSLAFAATASAGPVVVRPIAVEADLQKKFDDDYGTREIAELQEALNRALAAELASVGATIGAEGPITIETTLVDVKPSRPTLAQGQKRPGLDMIRSVSLGGAELKARLVAADGRVLNEFSYDWYEYDLANAYGTSTWSDARRAIRRYADRVAAAYRAQSPG